MTTSTKVASMIEERINWLAQFGKEGEGITRLLYTESWQKAQQELASWLENLGFSVYYDEVGNLFGRLEGKTDGPVILTGSHIDTVRSGGHFDGAYGIIASALAASELYQEYGQPEQTLEIVALCEEEGSRFPFAYLGSKYLTGAVAADDLEGIKDQNDISLLEAREQSGFTSPLAPHKHEEIERFIEIHIEQGKVLETAGDELGLVDAIVGQRRFTIYVNGEANHAGTTPMPLRRDAMEGASEMVQSLLKLTRAKGDPLVATVGQMELVPNSVNVIPSQARFSVDVRHPDKRELENACKGMEHRFQEIAEEMNVEVSIEPFMAVDPVAMDEEMNQDLERICNEQNVNYQRMYSGAGHDAQVLGTKVPASLLFVPSRHGISHSPLEFTATDELEKGYHVLKHALRTWSYKY
ncbi:Zn-dependent hydrolase [Salsuginibacillus kocurii]|uniref:Zn-dependent hydrolase n=1 Tax=Salsuginibacillus kocurii TaxID=427078 RepID=UPI00037E291C|nr:Zn-dependent hydrolase [Salsuginibacillus kocurii]